MLIFDVYYTHLTACIPGLPPKVKKHSTVELPNTQEQFPMYEVLPSTPRRVSKTTKRRLTNQDESLPRYTLHRASRYNVFLHIPRQARFIGVSVITDLPADAAVLRNLRKISYIYMEILRANFAIPWPAETAVYQGPCFTIMIQ